MQEPTNFCKIVAISWPYSTKPTNALQTLQEVIQQLHQKSPHQRQLQAAALACAWQAVMPQVVQKRTRKTFYKEGKLFVQLDSAPLRQELQRSKSQVTARLQAHLQTNEPLEIVFI